jgi:hypothetical protein
VESELIDSLASKHKYTSGVLSFAPGERIPEELEAQIMDSFESVAFAGLEKEDYSILWVRHTHAGPPGAKSRFFTVRGPLLSLSKRIMWRIT